ncbi:1,4-beta-xylanase [Spirosoma montaniterrae]|uniref:Beta-xylanase n=2 Tax=Spirosoma montaniterrae TaxID=1178516 RepID=A0A1P9X1B5_9BACT|nr:1,4-beta-xylanase [Spirosoma montaniterrae]
MFAVIVSVLFNLTSCTQFAEEVKPVDTAETSVAGIRASAILDSSRSLKASATFPVGVAFNSSIIKKSPKAYNFFYSQFNSKTVHAYMNTQPKQGQFNLGEVDYWVSEAEKKPIRLHGHCLVHRMDATSWFAQFKGNTTGFENAVKNHIQTVVGRHKGKIKSWDVFNEVFETSSGAIRKTSFRDLYTSDAAYLEFVKRCFQWANEADPNALLFYNDFNLESSTPKLEAVIGLVNNIRKAGVRIDGIGTQMHITVNTPNNGIRNSFQRLASTGLLIHVSELDIAVNPQNVTPLVMTQQLENSQAAKYQSVASLYKTNVPARLQYGITLWDFSDGDSWLVKVQNKVDMPNILDKDYNKKPAFYGFLNGLQN